MIKSDVLIIGAGIVGLTTAYNISKKYPNKKIIVLEKEAQVAFHQTGRNSGVIHSGIYYKPNSLKAINCRQGKKLLEAFCEKENISFELCGKLIVATSTEELERLNTLYERGLQNGVACKFITKEEIKDFEPHVNGIKALHIPETGIISYAEVCNKLVEILAQENCSIKLSEKVLKVNDWIDEIIVETDKNEYQTKYLINCAGLYSDKVLEMSGFETDAKIIPFRGEYFELKKEFSYLCKNLIYPVPDPAFPFLGVHFTRMLKGGVECGPNAVLAFAKEGYKKTDVNLVELLETLKFSGMQKVALKYWKTGFWEMYRSWNKKAFTHSLQKLIPEVREDYLVPANAGIRAQAIDISGKILDDFFIKDSQRVIHVLNAPSPAATSSFNIGKTITELLEKKF